MKEFERELAALLNKHSLEGESNTPDYVLAKYLVACLRAFNATMKRRDAVYRDDPSRSLTVSGRR